MTKLDWERERRRDPRSDPNRGLQDEQRKLAFIERLGGRLMSISVDQMRRAGREVVTQRADDIQRRLDYDLELCRWAADALPSRERSKFLRQAERDHAERSGVLVIITGEAFAIDPPKRHRIGSKP